jgi:hypothetical protein
MSSQSIKQICNVPQMTKILLIKKKGGYFCLIEQNLLALSSFCLTKEVHCKYFVVWEILMQFSVQGTLQIDS